MMIFTMKMTTTKVIEKGVKENVKKESEIS